MSRAGRRDGLILCAGCRAETVYPEARCRRVEQSWWRETRVTWWLRLRCGACGARREVVVGERLMERFESELDRAREAIARALAMSDRLRMATQVEAFALALDLDLIDAGDFAAPRAMERRR